MCRRTVHSLVPLLSRFQFVKIVLVAPEGLELPVHIIDDVCKQADCEVT